MKNTQLTAAVMALWLAGAAGQTFGEVRLPALFSDNMVVQQGMEVPVWGKAAEGEQVTVRIAGQSATAAARGGKWMLRLQPLGSEGPHTMIVSGANTITIKNVLAGDVWVCGGQSNMAKPVARADTGERDIPRSADARIRLFKVFPADGVAPLDDVRGQWEECGPETVNTFSAVGYYFGRAVQAATGKPVGLIQSCVGGTNALSWISREGLEADPVLMSLRKVYEDTLASPLLDLGPSDEDQPVRGGKAGGDTIAAKQARRAARRAKGSDSYKRPCAFYNGMIKPLQPYAIKGAIWYQGEANTHDTRSAELYRKLFPAMIESWRKDWGEGDFPFLFVQLPGLDAKGGDWPALRESQLKTLSLAKNTGMAVAIDLGEQRNAHPVRKEPVGERLALAARALVYGEKIEYSGPMYESMKVDGDKVVLRFQHAGSGLEARGGELQGFVMAGPDGEFVPANATIAGDTVIVSSPRVKAPVAVRYMWVNWPESYIFLYNKEGLPASPFRTDGFPLTEIANRRQE